MDPITQKRWKRFRRHRRAWASLWLLAGLLALGLSAELLCNDRPLYVRFEGRSCFPAFRFYPEDTFLRNGQQTRPDYKKLRALDLFRAGSSNFMVFAPVPFGPYETIDPVSIQAEDRVEVVFSAAPAVGHVNVDADGRVVTALGILPFLGVSDDQSAGLVFDDAWPLPPLLLDAIRLRRENRAAPPVSAVVARKPAMRQQAVLSLTAFVPREAPPRTVRIVLREIRKDGSSRRKILFGRDGSPAGSLPAFWTAMSEEEKKGVREDVRRAFEVSEPVTVTRSLAGASWSVRAEQLHVRWPWPPTRGHWMGIDNAGRDVLARILYGLRISLLFGLLLTAGALWMGTVIGAVQGYYGGWVDLTGQRGIEIWSSLPFLYVMILLGSVYQRSFLLLLVCYGLFNWIGISYYMRAEFLRLRRQAFVESSHCLGIRPFHVMFRHILPNALTPLITFFPFSLVGAIGSLAALDYLGFGLPPPVASWGELLQQAQAFRWAWWLIAFPSAALFLVILLGVFIGEGVRDAFDPRPFSRME